MRVVEQHKGTKTHYYFQLQRNSGDLDQLSSQTPITTNITDYKTRKLTERTATLKSEHSNIEIQLSESKTGVELIVSEAIAKGVIAHGDYNTKTKGREIHIQDGVRPIY